MDDRRFKTGFAGMEIGFDRVVLSEGAVRANLHIWQVWPLDRQRTSGWAICNVEVLDAALR
jgi:hypothetical protein